MGELYEAIVNHEIPLLELDANGLPVTRQFPAGRYLLERIPNPIMDIGEDWLVVQDCGAGLEISLWLNPSFKHVVQVNKLSTT